VFSCTFDQDERTDNLQAKLHLTGEQQVDIATGVRLSGEMTGWLNGQVRANDRSPWQPAQDNIWYSKQTEFE
jgi:hypothetical protein